MTIQFDNASALHSRLQAAIVAVCPITGFAVTEQNAAGVRIDYDPSATVEQQTAALAAVAAFDWSEAAQTTWQAQQIKAQARSSIDRGPTLGADLRERIEFALVNAIRDEFNRHSTLEGEMFAAVAAATSLADLKTRFAAITPIPQRSQADLATVIKAAIGTTPE